MHAGGNVKPDKEHSTERIDGLAAWCNAIFVSAVPKPEPFVSVYEERGFLSL